MSEITDELQPKGVLPLVFTVVVQEHRADGPWPVFAVEFRQDGHVGLKGPGKAGVALPYLIEAARKAGRQMVDADLRTLLLRRENGGTGAQEGQTSETEN